MTDKREQSILKFGQPKHLLTLLLPISYYLQLRESTFLWLMCTKCYQMEHIIHFWKCWWRTEALPNWDLIAVTVYTTSNCIYNCYFTDGFPKMTFYVSKLSSNLYLFFNCIFRSNILYLFPINKCRLIYPFSFIMFLMDGSVCCSALILNNIW